MAVLKGVVMVNITVFSLSGTKERMLPRKQDDQELWSKSFVENSIHHQVQRDTQQCQIDNHRWFH